jgi:rhodanese-related sulfurtransferase
VDTTLQEMMAAGRAAGPAISPHDAAKLIDSGQAVVVDVRDAGEVAASGRIKGAINVSRGHLEFDADPESPRYNPALRKDKAIFVYCNSGARATLACKTLKDLGFPDVRNLGGFQDWVAAGQLVEK